MKIKQNPLFQVLAATFLILIPLWYNGSPLYYPDSAGYIFWGLQLKDIPERAATYGLFIKIFSFGHSVWFNILFQSLIISFLIWILWFLVFKIKSEVYYLFSCFVLGIGSSLGWTSATLMPDLFCAASSICLCLLLFFRSQYSFIMRMVLIVIFVFSSVQHVSIFLVNGLIVSAYALLFLIKGQLKSFLIPFAGVYFLIAFSNFGIGLIHKSLSGKFYISNTSSAFLVGRFAETGVLNRYLDQNCANQSNDLCAYKTEFPMSCENFLWNKNSPCHKTGGINDSKGVFKSIVSDIFSTPKFLFYFLESGLKSAFKQLFLLDTGDGLGPNGSMDQLKYFPGDFADFKMSKQIAGIDFQKVNIFQLVVLFILGMTFLLNKTYFDLNEDLKKAGIFIAILLISNALANGSLATPLNRYQVRVFWLVYLWLLAALYPVISPYIISDSKKNQ